MIVQTYLERRWTVQDVELAERFWSTHNAGNSAYPFPKELFLKFIHENDGYFPIRFEALPEGTCAHIHVPIYQITAEGPYSNLVTYFESLLTHVWYPCTVATLSRRTRDVIDEAFERSVDEDGMWAKQTRLVDFGFRGVTNVEQAVIGGIAHLLNFESSDTMPASYYAQFYLNGGRPVGSSVPASEHSVMTSWRAEVEAFKHIASEFGGGVVSIVMDSYDYEAALQKIIPQIKDTIISKGGFLVMRPDSGDPVEVVLQGLRAAEAVFGVTVNKKGYKVTKQTAVLQGDGINLQSLREIIARVLEEGYSAQSTLYGMGGGLLQKVNRDTMSFATKVCHIVNEDGSTRDVMKKPKTDPTKISLPGELAVKRVNGIPTIFPKKLVAPEENLLRVVYDNGPVANAFPDDFDTLRNRVAHEWTSLPKSHNVISPELQALIDSWRPGQ
jgi:nicotinic acid phosphoribosyltransferase